MATIEKTYLDYPGLQAYDTKIKEYARSIKQIIPEYNSQTQSLVFLEDAGVTVQNEDLIFDVG